MNKKHCEAAGKIAGGLAKKVFESATHAAIFAFVSRKISNMMEKQEMKEKEQKLRIEEQVNQVNDKQSQ